MTQPREPQGNRRALLIAGAALALVVIVGLVVAFAGSSSDDDTTTDDPGEQSVFGPIVVEGSPLSPFATTNDDSASGVAAPRVEGLGPDGDSVTIGGPGTPSVIVFLAHWCPHCQREVPVLVELMSDGEISGLRAVAVLTGSNAEAPNFPPVAWLERERWGGEVLLDDEASRAAQAFGLTSYPFLVFLDGDGKVVARVDGELGADEIEALAALAR